MDISSAGNLSPTQPFSQVPAPSAFAQPQAASFAASQASFAHAEAPPPPPPYYGPMPDYTRPPDHHKTSSTPKVLGGSAVKWVIIVVITVVVLGAVGAGVAAYFLTRPQPVISVISDYKVGAMPAGSIGTVLHVSGQRFSGNSLITFLLDGVPAAGTKHAQSGANGTVQADLVITSAWSVGNHTLTARDASGYTTNNGMLVVIVPQGQANTPGPLGAPPDDASFTLNISIQAQVESLGKSFTPQENAAIAGHPDPAGGTVCLSGDNGQPQVFSGVTLNTGIPYRETATYSCTGTYEAGKLSYTETLSSDTIVFASNGISSTCKLNGPHVSQQLSGSYTSPNTFHGTVSFIAIPTSLYKCQQGDHFFHYGAQGTWTGQIAGS